MMLTRFTKLAACSIGGLALTTLVGCQALGVLAYKAAADMPVAAKYTPAQEPLVVIAENYNNPATAELDAEQVGRYISAELEAKKVAPIISPTKVNDLRAKNRAAFRKMNVSEIGAAVGAKQVLYIDIVNNSADSAIASNSVRVSLSAKVKIVDVATGATRWPVDEGEGFPVAVKTPVVPIKEGVSESTIRDRAHASLAARIARLFYKHAPDSEPTIDTP